MFKAEIEFANASVSWRFPAMTPALPSPFTDAFAFMIKELAPHGITPKSINLESQSSNLDDAAVSITLMSHRLTLRLTYSGIDAELKDAYSDDILQVLQILKVIFDTFEKIEPTTKLGTGYVKASLHLKMLSRSADEYLSERISANVSQQQIKPEAAVFSLDIDDITKQFPLKVTVAKSVAFEDGLFLEIGYHLDGSRSGVEEKEPVEFLSQVAEHYEVVLSALDLDIPKGAKRSDVDNNN